MPMIFSACLRSSFFTRVAAGEGLGEACGDGVGICANDLSGAFVATMAAAPATGMTLTNERRVIDLWFDFFMATFFGGIRYHSVRTTCGSGWLILEKIALISLGLKRPLPQAVLTRG